MAGRAAAGGGGGRRRAANKFDYGRRLAAALAYIALANTDKVTFTTLAVDTEKDSFLAAPSGTMRGKPGILRLMEQLKGLKTGGNTDLNASLSRFALRPRGRGW